MTKSILLIQAPYGDYTYPYHSLSYVSGALKEAGYEVEVCDLNAEWFRFNFTNERMSQWSAILRREFDALNSLPNWSIDEQRRAVDVARSLGIAQQLDVDRALETMTSDRFYQYDEYLKAQNTVRNFERLLEIFYPAYPFFTNFALAPGESTVAELYDGVQRADAFVTDVKHILTQKYAGRDFLFCGISMPFYGSLRLGFATMKAVGQLFPNVVRVAGGTAVTDVFKNRESPELLKPLGDFCEYLIPGEGDVAVTSLARWLEGDVPVAPKGLFDLTAGREKNPMGHVKYIEVSERTFELDYDWIDWSLYLSPARQVNYSPARGCFWNKCTFCDYGLNDDLPTAPYRAESVEKTIEQLRRFKAEGIDHVYLSADALAPNFIEKLADGIIEADLQLHWSAEFFLTKNFSPKLISKLEKSGLVTASFGYESGSSRVLEIMGKGKNRVEAVYEPVFSAFRNSTIGLQPKFFFGFPSETPDERRATIELLNRYREIFCVLTNANTFDLTKDSIVAKEPDRFGIRNVRRKAQHEMDGACEYELVSGQALPETENYSEFNQQLDHFPPHERPFAGGIDTFHTKLYVLRYGRTIFDRLKERYRNHDPKSFMPWISTTVHSEFDLENAIRNVMVVSLVDQARIRAAVERELSDEDLSDALSAISEPLERLKRSETYEFSFY